MARPANENDLNDERSLLEEELLPELEAELEGYVIKQSSEEYKEEFQKIVDGENTVEDYELPTILTAEYGLIFPEYFVVKEDQQVGYGAAVEPQTKFIKIQDESLEDAMRDFAAAWREETGIDEINLGRSDVSEVSLVHNEQTSIYAERI